MEIGEARRRADTVHFAHLATVRPDGAPHLVPITFALLRVDGADTIATVVDHKPKSGARLQRLDNIAHEPRCTVLFDHTDEDWTQLWWVRADGCASVAERPDIDDAGLAALAERYPEYERHRPQGPLITITVDRWSGWAYRDG